MRKGILLLFVVLCMTISANAQHEIAALNLTIQNPKDVYSIAEDGKGLAFLFKTNKQYQTVILTEDYKEQRKLVFKRNASDKREELVGGMIDSVYSAFYFHHPKQHTLSLLKINRQTGEQEYKKILALQPKEFLLKGFSMDGKFYFLTVMQYKNDLNVYSTSPDKDAMQADTYAMSFPTFYGKLSRKSDGTEEDKPVTIDEVKAGSINTIKGLHSSKKLYHGNGKIYISFDDPDRIHLLEIDINRKTSIYKKLNFALEKTANSSRQQGNSFIVDNTLFRVSMNPDQLNLTVINLDSMDMISSYNVFPEEEVHLANSPIVQEGIIVGFENNDEKIIRKTQQFFKKTLGGELAIVVNKTPANKLAIEIGSYEEFTVYRGNGSGMPMTMGGSSLSPYSTAYLGYGYPGFGYSSYFPNNAPTMTRINLVHFQSLFDSSYTHIQGNVPKSAVERIADYKEDKFGPAGPEVNNTTSHNQNVILGYLNKRNNKFQLLEFKK